jgi:hypothetical protein
MFPHFVFHIFQRHAIICLWHMAIPTLPVLEGATIDNSGMKQTVTRAKSEGLLPI